MRLLSVLALALSLAACASDTPSDDAPVPLATSTEAAPVAAEPVADEPTADEAADGAVDEIDPADASVLADPDPVPAAGPPEDRPAAPLYAESGLPVLNDTGMVLVTLHVAGCGESEGEDWAAMETWATDYLGDEVLMAGDTATLELAVPGCYVMRSQWEDGTVAQERVEATEGMTHVLMLG